LLIITPFNWNCSNKCFTSGGELTQPKPPTWRSTRVLLLVSFFTFDPSGKGSSTSSCAIAGVGLRILRTHKPLHPYVSSARWKHFGVLYSSVLYFTSSLSGTLHAFVQVSARCVEYTMCTCLNIFPRCFLGITFNSITHLPAMD